MANDLEPYENISRVFWIKIELKDIPWKTGQNLGEIRDVRSGVRTLLEDELDIIQFIMPYMQHMGIKSRWLWLWRFTLWMKRNRKMSPKKSRRT